MGHEEAAVAGTIVAATMVMEPSARPILAALWDRMFGTRRTSFVWQGQYPFPRVLRVLRLVDRRGQLHLLEPIIDVCSPIAGRIRLDLAVLIYACVSDPRIAAEYGPEETVDALTDAVERQLERQFAVVNRRTGAFCFALDAPQEAYHPLIAALNGETYAFGVHVAAVRVVDSHFTDSRQQGYRFLFYRQGTSRGDTFPAVTEFADAAREIVERGRRIRPWERRYDDALVEELGTLRTVISGVSAVIPLRP
ncbi:MAG: hypothetical protein HY341_01445 [Candidatus Kerfeldbacteria bacterium]|nr:hypothetical protein [Candidatus Kerfeldbacteria bacterium]